MIQPINKLFEKKMELIVQFHALQQAAAKHWQEMSSRFNFHAQPIWLL